MMRRNYWRGEGDEIAGAVRAGHGLLAGLLRCGRCGRFRSAMRPPSTPVPLRREAQLLERHLPVAWTDGKSVRVRAAARLCS